MKKHQLISQLGYEPEKKTVYHFHGCHYRHVEAKGAGGHGPSIMNSFIYKGPSCLKIVERFFVSVHFELRGFMKIL